MGRTDALMASLIESLNFLPNTSTRLYDAELLPTALQEVVARASPEMAWCCWHDRDRIWFYTGEITFDQSREHGRVVMRLTRYDSEGLMTESDLWIRGSIWQRLY